MTIKEVRDIVVAAPNTVALQNYELSIEYQLCSQEVHLKGIVEIYRYIKDQHDFWLNENNTKEWQYNHPFRHRISVFSDIYGQMIQWFQTYRGTSKNFDFGRINDLLRRSQNNLNKSIPKNHPVTEFLIKCFDRSLFFGEGALAFFDDNNTPTNKENFIGYMSAYEFWSKDKSDIVKRYKSEKSSLARIHSAFTSRMNESESTLTEHINNLNAKTEAFKTKADSDIASRQQNHEKWLQAAEKKKNDLEELYQELLRLKKPAEYWNKRAEHLYRDGKYALSLTICAVAIAALALYWLLWATPSGMLVSFGENQSAAIKWSILYVTFISLMIYVVRLLQRIAFSFYHLAQDAKEREELTYVYLSLSKETKMDEAQKNLIMQSLFSRADTGLLKDDSSPTMPNDFIGKIFSKN